METSTQNGLTVIYNEETLTFTFEWNKETHPEYNVLEGMSEDEFAQMIFRQIKTVEDAINTEKETNQTGGSGSGASES